MNEVTIKYSALLKYFSKNILFQFCNSFFELLLILDFDFFLVTLSLTLEIFSEEN